LQPTIGANTPTFSSRPGSGKRQRRQQTMKRPTFLEGVDLQKLRAYLEDHRWRRMNNLEVRQVHKQLRHLLVEIGDNPEPFVNVAPPNVNEQSSHEQLRKLLVETDENQAWWRKTVLYYFLKTT
jgi:hypothetical protein